MTLARLLSELHDTSPAWAARFADERRHGTLTGYTTGCRCNACVANWREYQRNYRAERRLTKRAHAEVQR